MRVDPNQTAYHAEYQGVTRHFCSARCRERFVADPAKYLSGQPDDASAEAPAGTMYICHMHPQVTQEGPVICPTFGQDLAPDMPRMDAEGKPELRDFHCRR